MLHSPPTYKGIQPITVCLKGVYYAPSMAFTLIFVSCLDCVGCSLLIEDKLCIIQGPHPRCAILDGVPLVHGLYWMLLSTLVNPSKPHHANITDSLMSINELHCCLSHLNFCTLWEMVSKGVVTGVMLDSSTANFCCMFVQGKARHQAFLKKSQTTFMVYGERSLSTWKIITISYIMICICTRIALTFSRRSQRVLISTTSMRHG